MNYILEDNYDFYAELKALAKPMATKPLATKPLATKPLATKPLATKPLATAAEPLATEPLATEPLALTSQPLATEPLDLTSQPLEGMCLISHEPLTYNAITLTCKHMFNYVPLYHELCIHNNKQFINCPYCRMPSEKLIPFLPLPTVTKIVGVNYPTKWCMPTPKCSFVKTKKCENNGLEYEHGLFCHKHMKYNIDNTWTPEKTQFCKTKSLPELKALLKSKGLKVGGTKKELVNRLFA
jgi:hypothetical protein